MSRPSQARDARVSRLREPVDADRVGAPPPNLSAALEALVELIADRVATRLGESRPRFYTRDNPPPGRSWRATLEDGRRGAYTLIRQGRSTAVAVDDYERWLASKGARPSIPPSVAKNDVDELAALGVVVPARRAGGAR